MSDRLSERSDFMSATAEASQLVKAAAEPYRPGEGVQSAIRRAASRLGWSFGRTRRVWYEEARRIDRDEIERAREVAAKHSRNAELLRREREQARTYLARLEARLTAIDPDFYEREIMAAREMGGTDRRSTD